MPVSNLRRLVAAIDEECPVLEYPIMAPPIEGQEYGLGAS